eukprot:COSAG01_NODE_1814_length_9172_cov_220.138212_11_plen_68_part_00
MRFLCRWVLATMVLPRTNRKRCAWALREWGSDHLPVLCVLRAAGGGDENDDGGADDAEQGGGPVAKP